MMSVMMKKSTILALYCDIYEIEDANRILNITTLTIIEKTLLVIEDLEW